MITTLEYAQIAEHVYNPTLDFYMGLDINSLPVEEIKEPKKTGWSIISKISSSMNIKNPNACFAALYIKYHKGKATDAVVAVRGTVPSELDNLKVDTVSWYSDIFGSGENVRIPAYFPQVLTLWPNVNHFC